MTRTLNGLRRAGPQDAVAVRQLTRAVYAKWIPAIGREPKPMAADYGKAVRDHLIDVLEDGVGLAALIEMIPEDGHLVVENVAVREDLQGNGLASLLLSHAEDTARAMGLPEVRLYTNAAFAANVAFYLRRGYTETARTRLPDGGTTAHFAKPVS